MTSSNETSRTIIKGTSVVSVLTLISRLLGFVREILVARLLGTGMFADAFIVAFRIPNMLRSVFAEGALTSAFVPTFSSELHKGKVEAQRAIQSVCSLLIFATLTVSILGIIFAPNIIGIIAPGFGDGSQKSILATRLTQIMFPYLVFVSIVAMVNGALNTVKIFGASAIAQVWMNVTLIFGAIVAGFIGGPSVVYILSFSVLLGGAVQVVAQLPTLSKAGFSILPSWVIFSPTSREVLKLMMPAILGATVYQLQIFLSNFLASLLSEGSVSWLYYADRLVQLPIGVFTISLASVLLPTLSGAQSRNDSQEFSTALTNSLRYTSFIMVPTAMLLFYFAAPLVSLLYERGAFTSVSSLRTSEAVKAYSIGLWAVSCYSMVIRIFIAKKDTLTPTIIGIGSLLLTFIFAVALMGPAVSSPEDILARFVTYIQSIIPFKGNFGHVGLALASSFSSFISLLIVFFLANKKSALNLGPFIVSSIKAICSCLLAVFIVDFLSLKGTTFLFLGFPLTMALYFSISFLLKTAETSETFALISRTISRRIK